MNQSNNQNKKLTKPHEQRRNLINYLGEKSKCLGELVWMKSSALKIDGDEVLNSTGCCDWKNFTTLLESLKQDGIVDQSGCGVLGFATSLTMKGWEEFEKLKSTSPHSKKVFMAMRFEKDGEEKNRIGENYLYELYLKLKVVLAQVGLELHKMDDVLHTENIVTQMTEVELRNCFFVIADLSHGNHGAYWEAGFAKGLNKKVIYLCQDGVEPHFDVKQFKIHFWKSEWSEQSEASKAEENKFLENIKATIRNVFHDDSRVKMNDENHSSDPQSKA